MPDPWIYVPPNRNPPARVAPQRQRIAVAPPSPPVFRARMIRRQEPPKASLGIMAKMGISFSVAAIGAALCAWHGYKRNGNSVAWAAAWGGAGFWCPVVAVPFAFSQGFARRA